MLCLADEETEVDEPSHWHLSWSYGLADIIFVKCINGNKSSHFLGCFELAFPNDQEADTIRAINCCSSEISLPSEPGCLQEATRHFKESYPELLRYTGASQEEGPSASQPWRPGTSTSSLRVAGHPITVFPLPATVQLLASF